MTGTQRIVNKVSSPNKNRANRAIGFSTTDKKSQFILPPSPPRNKSRGREEKRRKANKTIMRGCACRWNCIGCKSVRWENREEEIKCMKRSSGQSKKMEGYVDMNLWDICTQKLEIRIKERIKVLISHRDKPTWKKSTSLNDIYIYIGKRLQSSLFPERPRLTDISRYAS